MAARNPPPPGICRAFVIFSSLRASSLVGGVLRKNARGDATAKGGERKLSLSSAACSRVPSLLTSFAIIEELARRVFFSKICNAVRWGRTVQRKTHLRTTPLLMPSLYLYCMSFNFVGRRASCIIYQITCKKAEVFLIVPDRVTDTIFFFGPVHTYPDMFESATFSFRIRLPSTRIRCILHTNPHLFESPSRVEIF